MIPETHRSTYDTLHRCWKVGPKINRPGEVYRNTNKSEKNMTTTISPQQARACRSLRPALSPPPSTPPLVGKRPSCTPSGESRRPHLRRRHDGTFKCVDNSDADGGGRGKNEARSKETSHNVAAIWHFYCWRAGVDWYTLFPSLGILRPVGNEHTLTLSFNAVSAGAVSSPAA